MWIIITFLPYVVLGTVRLYGCPCMSLTHGCRSFCSHLSGPGEGGGTFSNDIKGVNQDGNRNGPFEDVSPIENGGDFDCHVSSPKGSPKLLRENTLVSTHWLNDRIS